MTYYCKSIAILLRNSAILLNYCSIEYCNSAIPKHYCYCFVQYSEKLLTVSLIPNKCYVKLQHLKHKFDFDKQLLLCFQFQEINDGHVRELSVIVGFFQPSISSENGPILKTNHCCQEMVQPIIYLSKCTCTQTTSAACEFLKWQDPIRRK